ncbi:hypothetical protein M5K25_000777 [Dendrobium thyrsiflorum]|uniref:Vesicle-associated membrane protein 714 n=1 Tax=Dendrobium thyrsiflorum TaxID=117978 RepID=A0ABD0WAA4_DENTH
MAILYAVVARGTVVLAEFAAVTGNTGAIARRILERLPPESDSRSCFSQDRYIFHVLKADGLIFLCMANDTFGRRIPFAYLEDIHMRFMKNYGRVAHSALAYAMNDEFARVLHHQMEYFSSNQTADTLNRLRGEVSEATFSDVVGIEDFFGRDVTRHLPYTFFSNVVGGSVSRSFPLNGGDAARYTKEGQIHTVMVDNIEKIMDRGDRIALLVDKTATMQDSAFHFKKQSRRLRQALWMKNAKLLYVASYLYKILSFPQVKLHEICLKYFFL